MLEGLPDILDGLSKLPNSNNLVGEFIQQFAGANGMDMEGKLTFAETASLFKFTNVYSEPRSRYLNIQVDFKENVGATLCENNIRFPQLLTNPFGILAGLALANRGGADIKDGVIFDSSFIHSKGKCVYDYIKQTNGSLFRNTIRNFIDNKEYDLKFEVVPEITGANSLSNAVTDDELLDSHNVITIRFNNKIVSKQNPIKWAADIFHEGIHAEIYRFVHKNDPSVKPQERARIFQLLLHFKGTEWGTLPRVQHIHMTQNYVIPIAKALRELDKNQYSLDHYMFFAWEGLLDHAPENIKPSDQQILDWAELGSKVLNQNNIPCQ